MAEGERDFSGDYTDSDNGDDLSRYRQEDQDYVRDNSEPRHNGRTLDDGKNSAGFGKFGRKKDDNGGNKWGLLKKGEKDASEKPNSNGKGGDKDASLGEKENNVKSDSDKDGAGGFKNSVKGINALTAAKAGRAFIKGEHRYKRGIPLVVVIASLITFGGGGFFGQMAMPFSLISQFQEQFDSISVSQNMRSKNFLRWQLGKGNIKDCIKAHYFKADEFKVSAKQKSKLANAGITFDTDPDGVPVMRHMMEVNGEMKVLTVVADASQVTDGRVSFEDAFNNDTSFRNSYSEGSRTWRGSIGAWFDSSMDKLLKKLGVERGVWREFKSGKSHNENMDNMRKTVASDADADSAKTRAGNTDTDQKQATDADGNPMTEADGDGSQKPVYEKDSDGRTKQYTRAGSTEDIELSRGDVTTDAKGRVIQTDGLKTKLTKVAQKVGKISGAAEAVAGVYCGIQDFVGAVSAIVAAYQTMQVLKTASHIFEAIQKAQAGDGDASPIHEIAQALTEGAYSSYDEIDSVNDDGSPNTTTIEHTRSAMEANAIGAIYGGTPVDMTDPSVKSFNISTITKSIYSGVGKVLGNISTSASAFRKCAYAKLAAATVSVATDVVTGILCVATAGIGCLVDGLLDGVASVGISAAFSLAVSVAVGIAVPHVAKVLTRKIATEVAGEDLGNALVTGAETYMGRNHQYSGGAVASKESLTSYLQERDRVIAENARYERETRSPFDITSKYTFLGSLVTQMIPLASSSTSLTGAIRGLGTVIGGAVRSLTPSSSAVSAGIEAQTLADQTEKYCPEMAEIGGIADFACSPYIITDTTTMNDEPGQVVNSISDDDLTSDENGNPVVVEDSKLAKYITYCGQRSSPWGYADQNIANEVDAAGNIGGTVGQSIIGAIPVVGDSFDIVSNKDKLDNYGWISGEACVVGNHSESDGGGMQRESVDWQDAKYYQRFIEDQRLAEAEGIIKESAVTQYLSSYYEKHPVDTSYEGLLARYSGLTKENVEVTLALLELGEWVADYHPADLAPFNEKKNPFEKDTDYQIEQSSIIASAFDAITARNDIDIDRRNVYSFSA